MDQNKDKMRATIYIAAGAYLEYLAYSLFKDFGTSTVNHTIQLVFIVLFVLGGIALIIFGGINFRKASQNIGEGESIYKDDDVVDVESETTEMETTESVENNDK